MELTDTLGVVPRWSLRDGVALAKPRLSLLVICTTGVGLYVAPGALPWPRALLILFATALIVGAANALNCYLERDVDALMHRTRHRPLPAQRLEPRTALSLSLGVGLAAIAVLYWAANPLTALLSFAAYALYGWVYTPMKRVSVWAVVVGALPGAIPPLMGYTAVTGNLGAPGWALFSILFFWQLPHFLAIAIYLRADYVRGGLKVLPAVWGERPTIWCALAMAVALVPASLWPAVLGMTAPAYAYAAWFLGGAFVGCTASGLWWPMTGRWARHVFVASIAYLSLLLAFLVMGARSP